MTQPAGNAPGAQAAPAPTATPVAPGASAAPTATPAPPLGLDPNAPVDVANLPANLQKMIADLRQEAGSHRQGKTAAEKAVADAAQKHSAVLAALGINADGSTAADPATAAAQLSERATQAEDRAWGATVKLNVFERATELGADPKGLLDSIAFVDSLDDLTDVEPSGPLYLAALDAKINAWMAANPSKGKPAGGRSGGEFAGGSGAGVPVSEAQLAQMSNAEKVQALREGKLQHLL